MRERSEVGYAGVFTPVEPKPQPERKGGATGKIGERMLLCAWPVFLILCQ